MDSTPILVDAIQLLWCDESHKHLYSINKIIHDNQIDDMKKPT